MKEQTIIINECTQPPTKSTNLHSYTLDQAMEESKIGKFQVMLIVLTGLAALGGLIENLSIGVVMPYAKCDLDISTTQQGLLSSVSFFGIFATLHLWGYLADTYGRQKVLRACVTGGFIFSLMSAFAFDIVTLIVLRFLAGGFMAGTQSATVTYIAEFHTSDKAVRAASFVNMFLPSVWIVLSTLSIILIPMDWVLWISSFPFKPWRLYLICVALINLWNAIVFSYLPESPKFLLAKNRKDEALDVLRRIYAFNTGSPKDTYPVTEIVHEENNYQVQPAIGACNIIRSIWTQSKPIFLQPLAHNTWKLCYVMFLLFATGHGLFMWFPDFLVRLQSYHGEPQTLCNIVSHKLSANATQNVCDIDNKNITPSQIMIGIGVLFLAFSFTSCYFMRRINLKLTIAIVLALSSTASVTLNFINEFYAIVITTIVVMSVVVCTNFITAYAVTLYPIHCRAMATSFILTCGRLGSVAGSNFVGLLLDVECSGIFYTFGGSVATCILVFMLVKDRTK